MTRSRLPLIIVVAAILGIVALTATTSGGAQKKTLRRTVAASAISVRQTSVGKVLVDANGRTVYLFALDKPHVSRLSAAGRAVWPPFTSTTLPVARGGASGAQIGRISATKQITYDGHPLYYYVGDQRPGQTAGQGLNQFGARWYVLSASGSAVKSGASNEAASQQGTGSYGGEGGNYAY